MAAALVVPEFSVGAGDLGDNERGLDDARGPAAVRKAPRVQPRDAIASPALARTRSSPAPGVGAAVTRLAVAPQRAIAAATTSPAPFVTAAGVPQASLPVTATERPALPGAPAIAEAADGSALVAAATTAPARRAPSPVPQAADRGAIEQLGPAQSQPVPSASSLAAPIRTPVRGAATAALPASAKAAAAAPASPAIAAAAPIPTPAVAAAIIPAAGNAARIDIASQLTTRVDGKAAGSVDFQQTSAGLKVRVGSIVEVLAERYDTDQLSRIRASAAGNAYLSLAELQASGIPISYDPVYDEFNVGLTDTRPKAARKVHMDQISAPERGIGATAMDQMRR